MDDARVSPAAPLTSFLSECLIWNVPDSDFAHETHTEDLKAALTHLYNGTKTDAGCQEWGELSELKYLFTPNQKWTRQQANDFILAAWRHVGFS